MTFNPETVNDIGKTSRGSGQKEGKRFLLRAAGWLGVVIAVPFFLWALLGLTGLVPSMIDIFGVVGMRIPGSVTIAGLLLAAIGFHQV